MILKFSALGMQNLEIANQKLKLFVLFLISVVKKCDEILGLNEDRAYDDCLGEITRSEKGTLHSVRVGYEKPPE